MPAHRTTTPHGRIEQLQKGIEIEAARMGLEGFSVTWENRSEKNRDPNIKVDGGFRLSFGTSGQDSRFLSVRQLRDDGSGRNHLLVGSKVVPLGVSILANDPTERAQNSFITNVISDPGSPFYGQGTAINRAVNNSVSGTDWFAAAIVGSAKLAHSQKWDLSGADFNNEFERLVSFSGGYTGTGPKEGGAHYTPPYYYVLGSSQNAIERNIDRSKLPKGPYFNMGYGQDEMGYVAGSYQREEDFARDAGMARSPKGAFTFVGKSVGKVMSAFQRMSRERYTQIGNDVDVSGVGMVGVEERGYTRGREILVGLTSDTTLGLREGRVIGSSKLLSTASYARPGQYRENIPETATIAPGSLTLDQSSLKGRTVRKGNLKGGWTQVLASFGDAGDISIDDAGYKIRELSQAPTMWIGTQGSSVEQFTSAIFGEKNEIMVPGYGNPLNRAAAGYVLSNRVMRRYGETDTEFGERNSARQSMLGQIRAAWHQTVNNKDVDWGDWKKVDVGFEGEDARPIPRGGEGFHITNFVWGLTSMVPSASFKSQNLKGVAAWDEEISPLLPDNSILATNEDVNKGAGWLDSRHQYWYSRDGSYRKWFNSGNRTVGNVEKRVSGLENAFNQKLRLSDPKAFLKVDKYYPTIQAHTAAEWTSTGRITLSDIMRAQQEGRMGTEELEYFSRGFRDTPVFGLLRALSKTTATDKFSKPWEPIARQDIPNVVPGRRLSQIHAHLRDEYGWDPSTGNKIEVGGLSIPAPSQVTMMGDNRQFMRAYEGLYGHGSPEHRQSLLNTVNNMLLEQVTSENSRAEFGKARTETGIYTQYSADPHLAGQNAIVVGPHQLREMFARSGGKRERWQEIMRDAKTGDEIGQAFVGREPAQVALQRMRVVFDRNMPRFAVPNISPEFELLTLGDSDGDPMKVFLLPKNLEKTIDKNDLARRAFGTLASIGGVDATLEFLHGRGKRQDGEDETAYLRRITISKDAFNPMIGSKGQNVALDRLKPDPAVLKQHELDSAQVQEQISNLGELRGKNAGIYNLIQTLRAGLNRPAVNQAFGSGRMAEILKVTGQSVGTYMGTALGGWYQYPLDVQKMPASMKILYNQFNYNMLNEQVQGMSTEKSLRNTFLSFLQERDHKYSPEELAALFGTTKKGDMQRLAGEIQEYWSNPEARTPELSSRKSLVGRTLEVATAIQFEQELLRGDVRKAAGGGYERARSYREEDNGKFKTVWNAIPDEVMETVSRARRDPLYNAARAIRRRAGTAEQFYGAFSKLNKAFKSLFGDIDLSDQVESRLPRNPEVIETVEHATEAEAKAAAGARREAKKETMEEVVKATLPPVDRARIDNLGKVSGRVTAVDAETVFVKDIQVDPNTGKTVDKSRQAAFSLAFASEGKRDESLHPVGKFIRDEWGNLDKNALRFQPGYAQTLAPAEKLLVESGNWERVMSEDENTAGKTYAERLASMKEGEVLVGHNITGADHKWLGGASTKAKIFDTMHIAGLMSGMPGVAIGLGRALSERQNESPELAAMWKEYSRDDKAHTAGTDAEAARLLFGAQINELAGLPKNTLESLASSTQWEASGQAHEDQEGYSDRMSGVFKRALEHKEKNNVPDSPKANELLGRIRGSGRNKAFRPASGSPPPPPRKPPTTSATPEDPNEPENGRGSSMDSEFAKAVLSQGQMSNKLLSGILGGIGRALKMGAGRMSTSYIPNSSVDRNQLILDTFQGEGTFESPEARIEALRNVGTGIGRIDALNRELYDKNTTPSRLMQVARGFDTHATRVFESTLADNNGTGFDRNAANAATMLFDKGKQARKLAQELIEGGPEYAERQRQKMLDADKRATVRNDLQARMYEAAKDDDVVKRFSKALDEVSKKVESFGETVRKAEENVEGRSELKSKKSLVKDAVSRAAAMIDEAPESAQPHMKKLLEATGDLTGAKAGSVLSEEDSIRAAEIASSTGTGDGKKAKTPLVQKLMSGFMMFSLARDWRMMIAPQIQGAENVMADRSTLVSAMSQSGITSVSAMYGSAARQMQYWADTKQGWDEAGYNMVSGFSQMVGGRPDELARNPVVGLLSASARTGLGVGAAFAFAGLPQVGLVAGAAASILGAGAYLQGYGSDTVARASDIYNGRELLQGAGSREQIALADSVRRQQGLSLQDYGSNTFRAAIYDPTAGVRPIQASRIPYYSGPQLRNSGQAILANVVSGASDAFTDAFGIIGDTFSKVKSALSQDEKYLPIGQTPEQWRRYIKGEMTEEERAKIYENSGGITGAAAARAVQMRNWTDTKDSTFGDIWKESGVSNEVRLGIVSSLVAGQFSMTPSGSTRAKQIAAQLASGLPYDLVMTTAEQLGAAHETGSAFPATLDGDWGGTDPISQKRAVTNRANLGGSGSVSAFMGVGMSFSAATQYMQSAPTSPWYSGGVNLSQSKGWSQGVALMQQGNMVGLSLTNLPMALSQGGAYTDLQMAAANRFLGNDPIMTTAMAQMGITLGAGQDWRSSTRWDTENHAPLFQYGLKGLSERFEKYVSYGKDAQGRSYPQNRSGISNAAFLRSELSGLSPAFGAAIERGVQMGDDWMNAMFGGSLPGFTGGREEVMELGAQKSYRNSLGSVGVSMAQARLARDFELNVTQPNRDISLQMQGISMFGGSMETKYGNYSAKGSFYWQQQELNFARQTSAIQFGRAIQGNQWEAQMASIGREGQLASRGVGRYDLGYQQKDLQLGHQYFAEDWSLNQQKRQLSFGWQQEDYGRNIRRATGFEKQQMIREQGRSVEMFNLETKQFEREKAREETKYKREQERWQIQKKQFETMASLEDQRFAIEQEQINKKRQWAEEDFRRENEAHDRQQKQLEEAKEAALLQYNMDKDQWEKQKEFSKNQFNLQVQSLGIQAQQIQDAETLRVALQTLDREAELRMRVNAWKFEQLFIGVLKGIARQLGIPLPTYDDQPNDSDHIPPPPPPPKKTGAMGASVRAGRSIVVGEYGPELVKFDGDATVVPTHKTVTQVMGPGKWDNGGGSETPVILKIDGKVIAEAVIQHGGPAMNRNQRRTFGL